MTSQQQHEVIDYLHETYGFDLSVVIDRQRLEFRRRDRSVYALPDRFVSTFADFPCIAVGMLIGEWSDAALVPSHELIARFSSQFTGQRWMLSDDQVTHWLTGVDLRGLALPYPISRVILLEDEEHRFIGRGKVLHDRLRNLLLRR
jgi:NOL1/NOP2/fmu family ribosome biogenesis protein